MNLLEDKVAIVTGASSGIGYAAAKLFAQEAPRSLWLLAVRSNSTCWSAKSKRPAERRSPLQET